MLAESRNMSSKRRLTPIQVATILEDFLEGRGHDFAWDDFTTGGPIADDRLEQIRIRALRLSEEFPPSNRREYTNEEGRRVLRQYIEELRAV
jgi:hypothetical protein